MTLSARDWRLVLVLAFAGGLALRLAVVGTPGFVTDVGSFVAWGERLRQLGPAGFYEPGYFVDYPPAYLYVLWGVASALGGMPAIVAKALSIPFDLAIALALYLALRRVADGEMRRRGRASPGAAAASERAGVAAAGLYLANPALVLAGPYWGQVDSAGTLPFLLALLAAGFGRFGVAGFLAGVALMVKPQFGLGLVAVLAAGAVDLAVNRRWAPLARAVLGSTLAVVALGVPFRLDPVAFVRLVLEAAESYRFTSLFAFNIWALVGGFWSPDDQRLAFLTYQQWSALLFALGLLGTFALLWRDAPRGRRWGTDPARDLGLVLAVGVLLSFAFYFLPTRVHERYLFPAFALLAPLAAFAVRPLLAYLALSAFFLSTLFYAFTRYPHNATRPPDVLEATLYQAPGIFLLTLVGTGVAAWLASSWWRRRDHALAAEKEAAYPSAEPAPAVEDRLRVEATPVPPALREGRRPTRRDIAAALLLALLVVLTRGWRLEWPRDMYFDEVYHARTAMELLAGREPYEWTHPHLAKEVMAVSIALFGDLRAAERGTLPPEATAQAIDGEGRRAHAIADRVFLVERDLVRGFEMPELGEALHIATDRGRLVAATRDWLAEPPKSFRLPSEPRALALREGRIFVATADELLVFLDLDAPPLLRVALPSTVAIQAKDATTLYVAGADGRVRLVGLENGEVLRQWDVGAGVATMAVVPNANRLFLGDAAEPVLHGVDLESGAVEHVRIENARTAPFRGPPLALAASPRTRLVWVLGEDGAAVVEPHGISAFAVVREAAGARALAIDDARDRVVAAVGREPVEISAGRVAFAWRLPGVVAAGVLAFFLFLLARRLFASRAAAAALAVAVLVDGALFTQPRIGMNDVYVAAAIVGGWYFVVAALQRGSRRPRLDLLIAGLIFGLGLAAKWAAGPPILAVGLAALVVTARAFVDGRPGTGGPLDLFAKRGANAAYLAFCFVAVPLGIYLASYVPWLGLDHGLVTQGSSLGALFAALGLERTPFVTGHNWSLVELQRQMFGYHSQLTAPHPAGSPWWSWPLDLKPVYWQYAQVSQSESTYIYDAGNIVTWWAGIPAMAYVLWQAARTRAWHLLVLALAFLTQYAQWIPVTRVLFQYHFFTALPFYLVGLAAALGALWERRQRWPHVVGLLVAGTLWFAWFYPWLSALPVPHERTWLYFWLPTWQYGCQFYPQFRCDQAAAIDLAGLLRTAGPWLWVVTYVVALAAAATWALVGSFDFLAAVRLRAGQPAYRGLVALAVSGGDVELVEARRLLAQRLVVLAVAIVLGVIAVAVLLRS